MSFLLFSFKFAQLSIRYRTAFRDFDLLAGSVQPVVEPVAADPASLLIHEQKFPEGIDGTDRSERFLCGLRKKDDPLTCVCFSVIHGFTDSFAGLMIIIGFFRRGYPNRSVPDIIACKNRKLTY